MFHQPQLLVMLLNHAQQLAEKALAKASELQAAVAIVIVDQGGHVVLAHRMDRAAYITTEVGRLKATTALNLQAPTHMLAKAAEHTPELREVLAVAFDKAVLLPGGFPIVAEGACLGGLGIAGGDFQQDIAIGEYALS